MSEKLWSAANVGVSDGRPSIEPPLRSPGTSALTMPVIGLTCTIELPEHLARLARAR